MKIKSLSFPYPVLGLRDDIHGEFKIVQESSKILNDLEKVSLKANILLSNICLSEMLEKKDICIGIEVTCAATFFRETFISYSTEINVILNPLDLRKDVEVNFYLICVRDVKNYVNPDSNKDYLGYSFRINKGEILGYAGSIKFDAKIMFEDLRRVSSFMIIKKNEENNTHIINFTLDNNNIIIWLPEEEYKIYDRYKDENNNFNSIFHASLVMQALVYTLSEMMSEDTVYEDAEWFKALTMKKEYFSLRGMWNSKNVVQIAQHILGNPYTRMMTSIKNITKQVKGNDYYE